MKTPGGREREREGETDCQMPNYWWLFLRRRASDIMRLFFSWHNLTIFRTRFLQYECCVFSQQSNRNSEMVKVPRKGACVSDYFYRSDTIVRVPWHQVRWNRLDLLHWVLQLSARKHATSIKQLKEHHLRLMPHLKEMNLTKFSFYFHLQTKQKTAWYI